MCIRDRYSYIVKLGKEDLSMAKKEAFYYFILLLSLIFLPRKGFCFDSGKVIILTAQKIYPLNVQIARTPEDWQQGARGLTELKENEGIFFLYPRETIPTFTTKGVSFPLDILLINQEGYIVGIFENAFGDKFYALPRPVIASLEVSGGFCKRKKIAIGDRVTPVGINLKPKTAPASKKKERKQVEAKLKQNLKKNPQDTEAYEELAVFYTLTGESEKAVQVFQDLVKLEATAPRLNGLGVALAQQGKWEEAKNYFLEAIKKDPSFVGGYNNLAKYYCHNNHPEKAVSLFEEAIKLNPHSLEAILGLFRLQLAQGNTKAAENLLQKARENGLRSPELDRLAGNIALQKGDHKTAAQYYLRYLKARPYSKDMADLKAFILAHLFPDQEKME